MRVLLTADTVGGVWTYACELAGALGRQGVQVTLATMGPDLTNDQRAEAVSLRGVDVRVSRVKLEWMDDPWADVDAAGDWLLDIAAAVRPDIIHLNSYAHGALPWDRPVIVAGHSCVLSWWEAVRNEPAPATWWRYRTRIRAGLRAADLVVAPTRAMLDALTLHYGPLPASQVIPNGRAAHLFPPDEKEPLILAAGRLWDEAKNIGALARVAGDLPWPVYVAGDNRHPHGGRTDYPSLRPLGRLAPRELARWLGRAAIYALPARYEPFGLSALEAALAGCALVLGDISSLREVWGDAAVFVPPDDPAALTGALHELIERPELRAALSRRARRRATALTPERLAAAYRAVYEVLIEQRQPVRPARVLVR